MPEFQPGQEVRVREAGGDRSVQPDTRFLGKEGAIQYGTGTLVGGVPTFYVVEFHREVRAIPTDWLEPR